LKVADNPGAVQFLAVRPIPGFWLAFALTRPFGAKSGDLLSQPLTCGGFGLGTIGSSAVFLASNIPMAI